MAKSLLLDVTFPAGHKIPPLGPHDRGLVGSHFQCCIIIAQPQYFSFDDPDVGDVAVLEAFHSSPLKHQGCTMFQLVALALYQSMTSGLLSATLFSLLGQYLSFVVVRA